MNSVKLGQANVDKFPLPDSGQRFVWDSQLKGFGVRLTPTGRSYIAQGKVRGKSRRVTLGQHGKITAAEARKLAKKELADMAGGKDPAAEKRRQEALSVTLGEVAVDYLESRQTKSGRGLKDTTRADIERHLASTFADWRNRPVVEITRDKVLKRYRKRCQQPLPNAPRSKPSVSQANQAMRVLGALIRYAAATYRTPDGARIIADIPTDVLNEANITRSLKARTSMVPLDKLGQWWAEVERRRADPSLTTASGTAVDMVAFLALTGLRLDEARTLRWENVDLDDASFRLPDPKNRRGVTLPLSDAATEILSNRPQDGEWVFPARSNAADSATKPLNDCRGQLELIADATGIRVTPHDLRRTFIQVGLKALGLELWRVKALSNHKLNQDVTLSVYTDLSDVRFLRDDADKIANHYEEQARIRRAGNVVPIGKAKA